MDIRKIIVEYFAPLFTLYNYGRKLFSSIWNEWIPTWQMVPFVFATDIIPAGSKRVCEFATLSQRKTGIIYGDICETVEKGVNLSNFSHQIAVVVCYLGQDPIFVTIEGNEHRICHGDKFGILINRPVNLDPILPEIFILSRKLDPAGDETMLIFPLCNHC